MTDNTDSNYETQQTIQYTMEAENSAPTQIEEPQEVENEYFVLGYN